MYRLDQVWIGSKFKCKEEEFTPQEILSDKECMERKNQLYWEFHMEQCNEI